VIWFQFTTDIRRIVWQERCSRYVIPSRGTAISSKLSHIGNITEDRRKTERTRPTRIRATTEKDQDPGAEIAVFRDTMATRRPLLTRAFRYAAFNSIHKLADTVIISPYVWPSMKVDCRNWAIMCAVSTCENRATCHCTCWKVRGIIKKVWLCSVRYHHNADVGRKEILPHLCRPFHAMARSIYVRRSRSGDSDQSILWRIDLLIWNTSQNHYRSRTLIRITFLQLNELTGTTHLRTATSVSERYSGKIPPPAQGSGEISRE